MFIIFLDKISLFAQTIKWNKYPNKIQRVLVKTFNEYIL